ncbi:MAG TPA: small basic family protein [Bacillota bacterium]
MIWLAIIGLGAGLAVGLFLPVALPIVYARYLSIAVLAALDSVFGGLRAGLEGNFDTAVFVSGFFGNALLAAALTYIGDRLGVELYYAALFALGYRLFLNLGTIRRHLLRFWPAPGRLKVGKNPDTEKGKTPST